MKATLYAQQRDTWQPQEKHSSVEWLTENAELVGRFVLMDWGEKGKLVVACLMDGRQWICDMPSEDATLLLGTCFPNVHIDYQ
jgi:hypothetical protein